MKLFARFSHLLNQNEFNFHILCQKNGLGNHKLDNFAPGSVKSALYKCFD